MHSLYLVCFGLLQAWLTEMPKRQHLHLHVSLRFKEMPAFEKDVISLILGSV